MGQILGFLTKKEGVLFNKVPIYAEEESHYSLANIFLDSEECILKTLEHSSIEESDKKYYILKDEEASALIYNNVLDFASDQINYSKISNETLPSHFRAIGLAYLDPNGEREYTDQYLEYENWANVNVLLNALSKITAIIYEDFKNTIKADLDSDYIRYSLDNIKILSITIKTLKKLHNIDEVALVYCPH